MRLIKKAFMRYLDLVISIRNKDYMKAFGLHLRKIRLSKNLSQGKLSILADIPLSQIGRIERGEVNTTISTIISLANALQVEAKHLLDFPYSKNDFS